MAFETSGSTATVSRSTVDRSVSVSVTEVPDLAETGFDAGAVLVQPAISPIMINARARLILVRLSAIRSKNSRFRALRKAWKACLFHRRPEGTFEMHFCTVQDPSAAGTLPKVTI